MQKLALIALCAALLYEPTHASITNVLDLPSQILGCPVNISQYISPECAKNANILSSSTLTNVKVTQVCSACSKDLISLDAAFAASKSAACTRAAPFLGLYCKIDNVGDFCLTKLNSPDFQQLTLSLSSSILSQPAKGLTAQQCKQVECCSYQAYKMTSLTIQANTSSPVDEFYKRVIPALDNCPAPVTKTCTENVHSTA
jgi:hypothetical protein